MKKFRVPSYQKPKDPSIIPKDRSKEYAFFSQQGHLYNSALLGGIRLDGASYHTPAFSYDTGIVQISKSGTYLFTYIVNIPQGATPDTAFVLQTNNQDVAGTSRTLQKNALNAPYTCTVQVILEIASATVVSLSSFKIIDITTPIDNTVASLTILEL